jgi:biopolymer transport protein ExbB/TolQ
LDSKRDIKDFSKYFSTDKTFNQLHSQIPSGGTMAGIFSSGHKEFTRLELGDKQAHAERAYRLMNTEANSEIDCLDSNLSILAMIAASSPYIGLFGTVWGIMHSFTIRPKMLILSLTLALLTIVMLSIYFLLYHQWNTARFKTIGVQTCHGYLRFK